MLDIYICVLVNCPKIVVTNPNFFSQMKSGETFRGLLSTAESSMNLQLSDCICTASNGKVRVKWSVAKRDHGKHSTPR